MPGITPTAPNAAHHAFNTELNALAERFAVMPAIERVALIAQFLGGQIATVSNYTPNEVMYAVSANLAAGNQAMGRTVDMLTTTGGETGLSS